jgi:hypothetical protein
MGCILGRDNFIVWSILLTFENPIKKNQAPDFSEARPIRRAVYIRPRCHLN